MHFLDCKLESNFRGDDDATFDGNSDGDSLLILLDPSEAMACGRVGAEQDRAVRSASSLALQVRYAALQGKIFPILCLLDGAIARYCIPAQSLRFALGSYYVATYIAL